MSEWESCGLDGYWVPKGVACEILELTPNGVGTERYEQVLGELRAHLAETKHNFLGYQSRMDLDFGHLAEFLDLSLNNIGDSFSVTKQNPAHPDGYFNVSCKWLERAVLDYYADLWHAPRPRRVEADGNPPGGDPPDWRDTYWGYALSMGSTEGNLMGLRNARDYLSCVELQYKGGPVAGALGAEATMAQLSYVKPPQRPAPIVLFSQATHYSVAKVAQIIDVEVLKGADGKTIKVHDDGTIDLEDLRRHVVALYDKDAGRLTRPIIVVLNYGTTFTGGYDDVEAAIETLRPYLGTIECEVENDDGSTRTVTRDDHWIHVDGALGAGYAPYLERAHAAGQLGSNDLPRFDFRLPEVKSIVVSGHKWPGAPMPSGVFMTLNKYLLTTDVPAYVGSMDSTLAGSRSGLAALVLWDVLARQSESEQLAKAVDALEIAEYARQQLDQHFDARGQPGVVHRAPNSLAVVFPEPPDQIMRQFSLPPNGHGQVHLLVMRHVTRELIDELVAALSQPLVAAAAPPARSPERDFVNALRQGW